MLIILVNLRVRKSFRVYERIRNAIVNPFDFCFLKRVLTRRPL